MCARNAGPKAQRSARPKAEKFGGTAKQAAGLQWAMNHRGKSSEKRQPELPFLLLPLSPHLSSRSLHSLCTRAAPTPTLCGLSLCRASLSPDAQLPPGPLDWLARARLLPASVPPKHTHTDSLTRAPQRLSGQLGPPARHATTLFSALLPVSAQPSTSPLTRPTPFRPPSLAGPKAAPKGALFPPLSLFLSRSLTAGRSFQV